MRALRRHVIGNADRAAFKQILGFRDFFSVSECRDLLLHVQEHQFDLTEVATMLRAVGLEFLAFTRIQHQARQIAAGQRPDNFLNPDDISSFERSQLKDAFGVVQSLQGVLGQRYQAGRF